MKKLLLTGVILVAVGLGLVLYADPVVVPTPSSATVALSTGSDSSGNVVSGGTLPSDCTTASNGGVQCTGGNGSAGGPSSVSSTAIDETLAGVALCGLGLALSIVESATKPQAPEVKPVS